MINLEDNDRNSVIDVHFTRNDTNGQFHIRALRSFAEEPLPEDALDMSDYAGGRLVMDIRLLDPGESTSDPYGPRVGQLNVAISCGWPCGGAADITPGLDEWQTFTFNIDDFVNHTPLHPDDELEGLDLSQIWIAFAITPLWNYQQDFHFQLDNIRWEKQ